MTKRKPPLVSVLMPFHDARLWLAQAIESVFAQTHRTLELIAIDDASRDEGIVLARDLWRKAPIPMRLLRHQHSGPSGTLHRALALASGEWVCWLAADDLYAPDFVETNLHEAQSYGDDDIVLHSNAYLMEADGTINGTLSEHSAAQPLRGDCFELWASGGGFMAASTMFIRRELLERAGGFNPNMFAEDLDLRLRLARAAPFHYVEKPIYYLRHTPGSLGRRPWLWAEDAINAIKAHEDVFGGRMPDLLARVSANVAVSSIENGSAVHGARWARRAVRYSPGFTGKSRTAVRLVLRTGRAILRSTAMRLFGRERLVKIKRRLVGGRSRGQPSLRNP